MLMGHPVPGKRKSADIVAAFIEGAPKDAVGNVFYGVTDGNYAAWLRAKASGEPWFYCDNSYLDQARGTQFRVTRNALQHTGQGTTDGKRLEAIGVEVEPVRAEKGFALIVLQSDVYMRWVVEHAGDWPGWIARALRTEPAVKWRRWSSDKPSTSETLRADLLGARLLLTHSSAAAVLAVLAGVRVRVWPVSAAHCFNNAPVASDGERWRWASVLADNQFLLSEMRDGTAWRMLHG